MVLEEVTAVCTLLAAWSVVSLPAVRERRDSASLVGSRGLDELIFDVLLQSGWHKADAQLSCYFYPRLCCGPSACGCLPKVGWVKQEWPLVSFLPQIGTLFLDLENFHFCLLLQTSVSARSTGYVGHAGCAWAWVAASF